MVAGTSPMKPTAANGGGAVRRDLLALVVIAVVVVIGASRFPGFSPAIGESDDGFKVQISYILGLWDIGALFDVISQSSLLAVHAFRVLSIAPFLIAESYVGTGLSLLLLELSVFPLIRAIPPRINPFISVIPLTLPLMLSGRSVLVAVGVGYMVLFLLRERSSIWLLILGMAWVNLSSASVLSALLLLLTWRRPHKDASRRIITRAVSVGLLGLSLYASLLEKQYGFSTGGSGYQSFAFANSNNIIVNALSRATIFVSIADGQYVRGFVYGGIALYVLYKVVMLTFRANARHIQIMLACCVPGILLEGQGVVALVFPVFWLLIGALTPPRLALPAPRRLDHAAKLSRA